MTEPRKKIRLWLKRIGLVFSGLITLVMILIAIGVFFAPDFTTKKTPAGYAVNTICYLPLDSRSQVFVSAWLPLGLKPGERIPALIRTERYADQFEIGWLGKVMSFYTGEGNANYDNAKNLLDAGYAFVFVQSPGSCQSSGERPSEYPPGEVTAIGLAIDWIAGQPWSNQRVGAYGGSYSGTTADMSPAALRPQLRAIYPSKPDFDPYTGVIRPGGLGSNTFIRSWAGMIRAMDADDIIGAFEAGSGERFPTWQKWFYLSMISGLKHPSREDMAIFRQALEDHRSTLDIDQFCKSLEYKDARTSAPGAKSMDEIALYRYKAKIEQAQVNTFTRVGWIDAGAAEGALQKFLTFNTPQKLVLLPTGHRLSQFVDLFGNQPNQKPEEPGWSERHMLDYFDRHLKSASDSSEERLIVYYTYGANSWRETTIWPPEGIETQTWYLGEKGTLSGSQPTGAEGSDRYTVDLTTDTGMTNRWMGQMGWSVQYTDRRQEDKKLLTYTSSPLAADLEITGSPTVVVHVASTHNDGAFHVYLEDVGPDGRVTYFTEGLLRAIHRQTRPPESAPYVPLGVYHSYLKGDALPMVPGEISEIPITLQPISVIIKKGHSIRIAIAGFDKTMGARHPETGTPTLTFWRSVTHPSHIVIPSRPWQ